MSDIALKGHVALKMGASQCKSAPYLFGFHGSSVGGDTVYSICQMTSHNHIIEVSSEFMSWGSLRYVTTLISLVTISIVVAEICFHFVGWPLVNTCSRLYLPYCLSLKCMACRPLTHEISGRRRSNLPVCPVQDYRSWSHMSTRTTEGICSKSSCQCVKKERQEERKGNGKAVVIAKDRQLQTRKKLLCWENIFSI